MTSIKRREIINEWWFKNLKNDNDGDARALSARLRRVKSTLETLSEEAVFELGHALKISSRPQDLALLAMSLAHVKENSSNSLARCFGEVTGQSGEGKQKKNTRKLSEGRFQNIMRVEDPMELATQLRRALPIVGNACNVGRLGEDLLNWNHAQFGEHSRARWWFDYFGSAMPAASETEARETTSETEESAS